MEWLKDYCWIILLEIFINIIKDLNKLSYKNYIKKKKNIKPVPYSDDDWSDNKSAKK